MARNVACVLCASGARGCIHGESVNRFETMRRACPPSLKNIFRNFNMVFMVRLLLDCHYPLIERRYNATPTRKIAPSKIAIDRCTCVPNPNPKSRVGVVPVYSHIGNLLYRHTAYNTLQYALPLLVQSMTASGEEGHFGTFRNHRNSSVDGEILHLNDFKI